MRSVSTLKTEAGIRCLKAHLSVPGDRKDRLNSAWKVLAKSGFDSFQIQAILKAAKRQRVITTDEYNSLK